MKFILDKRLHVGRTSKWAFHGHAGFGFRVSGLGLLLGA